MGARRVVVLVVVTEVGVRGLGGEEAGVAAVGAGDQRRGGLAEGGRLETAVFRLTEASGITARR
ncbi:hypothetical protein ACFCV8_07835 [Streptomyces sp. NPDC056347]|uniref:hypothetical protein n=1 Tax=Streptomyces sp. NPDC056347 TaxID=3345790 RepID=UPI0035DD086F